MLTLKPLKTEAEWIEEFIKQKAWWTHNGDYEKPHVIMTNGSHSDGYFNSRLIMQSPDLADQVVADLTVKLVASGLLERFEKAVNPKYIVGPATGAIILSHTLARTLYFHLPQIGPWLTAYTRKKESYIEGRQMLFDGFLPKSHSPTLLVEDTITTSKSIELTASECLHAKLQLLPYVMAIVNRSELTHTIQSHLEIISLVKKKMNVWPAPECPLCPLGSRALTAKFPAENWEELTA